MPENSATTTGRAARRHPFYGLWVDEEHRHRASYLATRRHLAPFLVPHRFEGKVETTDPTKLRRAQLGYGIGLNKAWLTEILGHVRDASATYEWGPLETGRSAKEETSERPAGGIAQLVWDDATRDGYGWRDFMEGIVLEWMASSPGGFVVVDNLPGAYDTQAEELAAGKRPYCRFIPMSHVADLARDEDGFPWIRILLYVDRRDPFSESGAVLTVESLLYYLDPDTGVTLVERWDQQGNTVQDYNLGRFENPQGRAILPVVQARHGQHPDLTWMGSGLLMGLADIVIDLFNTLSETREAYRDAAFSFLTHRGPDSDKVQQYLDGGARLVPLGDEENAALDRVAGDAAEVQAGLELVSMGVQAWALSAKRKAADGMSATRGTSSNARSGISLQAEFQLDARPLLVALTERLDEIESAVMFIVAQMAGIKPQAAKDMGVERSTAFSLEEEASRITRLVTEFVKALPLPPVAQKALVSSWADQSNLFDMDAVIPGSKGKTMREQIADEAGEMIDQKAEQDARQQEAMTAAAEAAAQGPPGDPTADGEAQSTADEGL